MDANEIALALIQAEETARANASLAPPPPAAQQVIQLPAQAQETKVVEGNKSLTFIKDYNFTVPKGYILYYKDEGTIKNLVFETKVKWTNLRMYVDDGILLEGSYIDFEKQNLASYDPNTQEYSFNIFNQKFNKEFYLKIDTGITIDYLYTLVEIISGL